MGTQTVQVAKLLFDSVTYRENINDLYHGLPEEIGLEAEKVDF